MNGRPMSRWIISCVLLGVLSIGVLGTIHDNELQQQQSIASTTTSTANMIENNDGDIILHRRLAEEVEKGKKKKERTAGPDRKKQKQLEKDGKESVHKDEDPKQHLKERAKLHKATQKKERKEVFAKAKLQPRSVLVEKEKLDKKIVEKIEKNKKLTRREKKALDLAEQQRYAQLRADGVDEISDTANSKLLRDYRLRNKKRHGLFRKREASLAQILFPGVSPEDFDRGERMWIYTDIVESRLTPVPFDVYDLPGYYEETEAKWLKRQRMRRNLGSRLLGHDTKPAPFMLRAGQDVPCTVFGTSTIGSKELVWLRQLVQRQYRVHMTLDSLPVLLKSRKHNFAIRGYPIGFKLQNRRDLFLYNHLKFTITYRSEPSEFKGLRITGFEVRPVSTKHDKMGNSCTGFEVDNANDPSTYVALQDDIVSTPVVFSYDIKWKKNNDLEWADRWDVYLVSAPDDDIHYYSIVNSIMIVLVMTVAIATIMIRTLRNDIATYNELVDLEDGDDETGWKLVHGDVFRAPAFHPMILSVAVGTGAQIGAAGFLSILLCVFHFTNAMNKGQMLTSLILLYVACGAIAGYISSLIYRLAKGESWKLNTIMTAVALPGFCFTIFAVLNIFLSIVHAATSVSFITMCVLFLLWICVSAPLVFLGSFIGLRGGGIKISCRVNSIARIIPDSAWSTAPAFTALMGGILPFGSVCIELAFIMSALWLHQLYYVMGFLLAVGVVLVLTCAQVSIVMCYLQLCAEDHQWWWKSFWNCASGGIYVFFYSIWFLSSRLQLIGGFPIVIYLSYMAMISVGFGLFCGSVGFLSSLWFTKTIYGSVKVD